MKWHIDKTKLFLYNTLVCKKTKNSEQYYLNGQYHNHNGPAYRLWYENGQLCCEEYWVNGRLHNPNGMAICIMLKTGLVWDYQYWIEGEYLTKEQFFAKLNK